MDILDTTNKPWVVCVKNPVITDTEIRGDAIWTPGYKSEICPVCGGNGFQKAMRMAQTFDGPSVRVGDAAIPCANCGGLGLIFQHTCMEQNNER